MAFASMRRPMRIASISGSVNQENSALDAATIQEFQ
jgi:hypothetical protein